MVALFGHVYFLFSKSRAQKKVTKFHSQKPSVIVFFIDTSLETEHLACKQTC